MSKVKLQNKWIFSESVKLQEMAIGEEKKLYLETRIVPFGEISRNRIKYNEDSVKSTHQQLIGKPLNHNHETEGANVFPRGEWVETYIKPDGMYGKAEVYNTKYNEDYIDWLRNAKCPRVSLQVNGSAENRQDDKGSYKEAFIEDWLEGSTVIVPGFDNAKGNFIMAMAEAFKENVNTDIDEDNFFKELNNIYKGDHLQINDIVEIEGKYMKVSKILDNGYELIYLEDEEEFFEKLNRTREKYEEIPDKIIDSIIKYIENNKDKNLYMLQDEIKNKFGFVIDINDLRNYQKVL